MTPIQRDISLRTPHGPLIGHLVCPEYAWALILMPQTGTHPAHVAVHAGLEAHNVALLQIELLTSHEARFPDKSENTPLLAERLTTVLDFVRNDGDTENLPLGIFAADQLAPVAVRAAARRDQVVGALVTAGGFIDRAGREYLRALAAPLQVLLQAEDTVTVTSTRHAFLDLRAPHELHLIEAHEVATESVVWFKRWLMPPPGQSRTANRGSFPPSPDNR